MASDGSVNRGFRHGSGGGRPVPPLTTLAMLRVPFETMVCLYLLGTLATVAASWAWDGWRARRTAARARRFRLRCARCALEWEDPTAGPLPTCPRCGSVNERTLPPEL